MPAIPSVSGSIPPIPSDSTQELVHTAKTEREHEKTLVHLRPEPCGASHVSLKLHGAIADMAKSELQYAFVTVVKILTNHHGHYPSTSVTPMPRAPGSRGDSYKFEDPERLRRMPPGTHHFYCEADKYNEIGFISIRKKDGTVIGEFPEKLVIRSHHTETSLILKFRLGTEAFNRLKRPISPNAGESAQKRQLVDAEEELVLNLKTGQDVLPYAKVEALATVKAALADQEVTTISALFISVATAELQKTKGTKSKLQNLVDPFLQTYLQTHQLSLGQVFENFQSYAAFETAFVKRYPDEGRNKSIVITPMRTAFFPRLPSQLAFINGIGEEEWQRFSSKKQVQLSSLLGDFDRELASQGKNLPNLSATDFIGEWEKIYMASSSKAELSTFLQWLPIGFKLPLDSMLKDEIATMKLEEIKGEKKEKIEKSATKISVWAYKGGVDKAEFFRRVVTNRTALIAELVKECGDELRVKELINGIAKTKEYPAGSGIGEALRAIGKEDWEKVWPPLQPQYLAVFEGFGLKIPADESQEEVFENPKKFVEWKHAYCKKASDTTVSKAALGMWRRAKFQHNGLDERMFQLIKDEPLKPEVLEDFTSKITEFTDFAIQEGLSKDAFLQRVKTEAKSLRSALEEDLVKYAGAESTTRPLVRMLARKLNAEELEG